MKHRFKTWLLNRLKRRLVKTKKLIVRTQMRFEHQEVVTDTQILAINVVKKAIAHSKANLQFAPISGTRYISYGDIFIRLDYKHLTIINGVYSYNIYISEADSIALTERFNHRLERLRKMWEYDITAKTNRSLNTILAELSIPVKL
jgi:hypothetical protein